MVRLAGLEPATQSLENSCSIQLSYSLVKRGPLGFTPFFSIWSECYLIVTLYFLRTEHLLKEFDVIFRRKVLQNHIGYNGC